MRNLNIYSDMHLNGPTPTEAEILFGPDCVFLGDNHEFKNVPKKDIFELKKQYSKFLFDCHETGATVMYGNHEVSVGRDYCRSLSNYNKELKTLFCHGHTIFWSHEGVVKWMDKKPGKGTIYLLWIKFKNQFRFGKTKFSKNQIRLVNNYVRNAEYLNDIIIKNVVFGHTHPKNVIDETHFGIRMINVPQGLTELEI